MRVCHENKAEKSQREPGAGMHPKCIGMHGVTECSDQNKTEMEGREINEKYI